MNNRLPFAALTFAFTVSGSCIGYALHGDALGSQMVTFAVACIGAFAAAFSGDQS